MSEPLHPDQLRCFTPLNVLSDQQWRELRPQLVAQPLLPGQLLFRRGDQAFQACFLLSGDVLLQGDDGQPLLVSAGSPASLFALSPSLPRRHDAQAASDASVLILDGETIAGMLAWQAAYQDLLLEMQLQGGDLQWLECLLENPLFAKVPPAHVRSMIEQLQPLDVAAGQSILREGEAGDCCYFLKRGRAEVMRAAGSDQQLLAELEVGACFGEEALLSDSPRNASVTMLEDGQVLRLDRQNFLELLKEPVVAEVSFGEAVRMTGKGAQWLDVRRQDEYEAGHALQSLHMPLDLLRLKVRLLDPQRTYLCYCDNGKRSVNAVYLLKQLGFQAYALHGGVDGLSLLLREGFLCELGAGNLVRSGGRTEPSR